MSEHGRWLTWTPRALALAFAAFLSIFALDVFDGSHDLAATLVALGMHLIPTGIVLLVLALAWRWPWVGALGYTALGVAYAVTSWARFPASTIALIAGPLVLTGVLFAFASRGRRPAAA